MINKRKAIKQMRDYGDFIIEFNKFYNSTSEPVCCTTDFKNKYIRSIRRTQRFNMKGNILVFNWTDNEFQAIPVNEIYSIQPLANILKNVGVDDGK